MPRLGLTRSLLPTLSLPITPRDRKHRHTAQARPQDAVCQERMQWSSSQTQRKRRSRESLQTDRNQSHRMDSYLKCEASGSRQDHASQFRQMAEMLHARQPAYKE